MRKLILSLFITVICASAVQAQSTFYTVQQLEEAMNGDRIIAFWTYLHKQGSSNLALKGIRLDSLMIAMDSMIGSGGGGSAPDYYQTVRLNGTNATQRQALNFVNNPGVFQFNVTDDAINGETEVTGSVTGLDLTSSSTAIVITGGTGTTLKNTQLDLDPSQIILSTLGGELNLTQISDGGAATGDILQWNGTAWVPTDVSGGGGSYVAGAGIDITGVIISNTGDLLTTNEGDLSVIEDSPTQVSLVSNTSGSTNVLIVQGDGIDITADELTNTLTITNTGDTDASDDLTDATIFDGDVTGTYNDLQIKANAVGTTEIANGAVTMVKINQAGATSGQVIKWNGSAWAPAADSTGGGGFYQTIQEEGSDLTQRDKLNFVGSAATATDDGANSRTNLTFDTDVNALADIATTGVYVITGSGSSTTRTITAGTGISVTNGSGVSGNPTITNTGDLSATNELQIFTNSSDATNHYLVLSDGGGSITFTEGSGITLTTSGTSDDGIVTIAATGGGSSNYQLLRDDGVDMTAQPNANFTSTSDITFTLTNDGANNETEIASDIPADAVDFSEMQNITTGTLIGRSTAGTGDPESITVSTGLTISGGNLTANDDSATNEAWTADADDADTELITNQTVKFEGAGIITTDYVPASDKFIITGTEVDGSTTNEIQDLSITGTSSPFTLDISGSANDVNFSAGTGITLSESPANTLVISSSVTDTRANIEEDNALVITNPTAHDYGAGFDVAIDATEGDITLDLSEVTEQVQDNAWNVLGGTQTGITVTYNDVDNNVSFVVTDASTTNEVLTISDGTDSEALGGQTLTVTGAGITTADYVPATNTLTITSTEVDGSVSNELQTIANTSDATSHTATLSNSGGSIKLAEGSGISLTTTGTGLDGIVTIAATGGGASNYQLWRDDGVDATARANANFVSNTDIAFTLTDDGVNTETEVTADILAQAVDFAEIQNIGTGTLAGRSTAGSGSLEQITVSTGLTISGGNLTANDASATNEAWTADADDADTELITNQTVKFEGAGIVTTDYVPASDKFIITATEVDGSTTNEVLTISDGTDSEAMGGQTLTVTGAGITTADYVPATNTLTITSTEVDGSTTNEAWTADADDADTELITNQTVKFEGAGIVTTDYVPASDKFIITATEVDGSITNELQTIANTSDATSHTVTLSNSGGSIKLVEGSGITLTTTGTSGDGIVTVASTGASSSIYTANGTVFPNVVATVSTGNSVNFAMSGGASSTFNVGDISNTAGGDGFLVDESGVKMGEVFGASDYYIISGKGYSGNFIRTPASNLQQQVTGTTWDILSGATDGFKFTDNRATKKGVEYTADYSSAIIANNRSFADVGSVKAIFTAGTGITLTPSGSNVVIASTVSGADGNGPYSGNGGNGGNGTIPSVTNSVVTNQWTLQRTTDDAGTFVPFRIKVDAGNEPDFMSFVNGSDSLLISKGDQEFQIEANKNLVLQSTDLVYLIGDSINISNVPTAFDNEATLLFQSPSGAIVKAEGLDPDIIRQNSAAPGDVLKWNGSKWAPAVDGGGTVFYQTLREDGTAETQRGKTNFLDGTFVTFTLTDDAGNDETEIGASIVGNSLTAAELADNSVGTGEIAALAVTNAKINDVSVAKLTSGTIAATLAMTMTNNGEFSIKYPTSATAALYIDDTGSAANLYSEDGTQFLTVNNVSSLLGSGGTYAEYIDGVFRLFDSDATQYIGIKTPATGSLTTSYTLTLPVDDGTVDQVLKTDGSGNLSWTTPASGSGDVLNNGNSFGAAFIVGSNDNNTVSLEQNGTTVMTIGTDKNITTTNSVAATATVTDQLKLNINSTGTAANSFGNGILFSGESSTTNDQEMARQRAYWTTATHASREAAFSWMLGNNAGALAEVLKLDVAADDQGSLSIGSATPVTIDNDGFTVGTDYIFGAGGGSSNIILGNTTGVLSLGNSSGLTQILRSSVTTNAPVPTVFTTSCSSNTAVGFGNRIQLISQATSVGSRDIALIDAVWTTATDATRTSDVVISTVNSATTNEAFRVYGNKRAMVGGGTNQASAAFQVTSTTGGILPPKVTTTEMNAIASPVEGLSVYNTTEKGDFKYDGSGWHRSSMDAITGRSTAQTAAVASVATLTVGSADASYQINGNILVTTSGSESFSLQCDYTDEGNTARTITIPIVRIATGGFTSTTISASGAVPYPSTTLEIRCKASTAITIKTSGTFTGCTYNVEGFITRIQ